MLLTRCVVSRINLSWPHSQCRGAEQAAKLTFVYFFNKNIENTSITESYPSGLANRINSYTGGLLLSAYQLAVLLPVSFDFWQRHQMPRHCNQPSYKSWLTSVSSNHNSKITRVSVKRAGLNTRQYSQQSKSIHSRKCHQQRKHNLLPTKL